MGGHLPCGAVSPKWPDVWMNMYSVASFAQQTASQVHTYLQSPHLESWLPVLRMTQSPGTMHSPPRLHSVGSGLLEGRREPLGLAGKAADVTDCP